MQNDAPAHKQDGLLDWRSPSRHRLEAVASCCYQIAKTNWCRLYRRPAADMRALGGTSELSTRWHPLSRLGGGHGKSPSKSTQQDYASVCPTDWKNWRTRTWPWHRALGRARWDLAMWWAGYFGHATPWRLPTWSRACRFVGSWEGRGEDVTEN
jgi:hypothetical protein